MKRIKEESLYIEEALSGDWMKRGYMALAYMYAKRFSAVTDIVV